MTSDAPPAPRGTVAVVLAAGAGRRFGGPGTAAAGRAGASGLAAKLTAVVDGRPLLAHALDAARAAGIDRVRLVVPGDDAGEAAAHLAEDLRGVALDGVDVRTNPDRDRGLASSLAVGVAGLADDPTCAVVVVLLADEVGLDPAALTAVVAAVRCGAPAARARYTEGPGHPVAFARDALRHLRPLTGDTGARDLLAVLGAVEVPVAGPRPVDVDTPDDLAALGGSGAPT